MWTSRSAVVPWEQVSQGEHRKLSWEATLRMICLPLSQRVSPPIIPTPHVTESKRFPKGAIAMWTLR